MNARTHGRTHARTHARIHITLYSPHTPHTRRIHSSLQPFEGRARLQGRWIHPSGLPLPQQPSAQVDPSRQHRKRLQAPGTLMQTYYPTGFQVTREVSDGVAMPLKCPRHFSSVLSLALSLSLSLLLSLFLSFALSPSFSREPITGRATSIILCAKCVRTLMY